MWAPHEGDKGVQNTEYGAWKDEILKIESKVSAGGCGHLKIFHLRSEMVQMSVVPLR